MKLGNIEIQPLAAESMGVRSLCTRIDTPDVSVLLDASAALAFRYPYEPHPLEYKALQEALARIEVHARECDIITVSHYHFDHVRPGATNFRYNLSTPDDRIRIYGGKHVLMKDGRTNINASQRRRAYYFEKDLANSAILEIADGKEFKFDETTVVFSHPLSHGPEGSALGFVLAVCIDYDSKRVLFAPDVQGPISRLTLEYLLSFNAEVIIVGGPPIYLRQFTRSDEQDALHSLVELAKSTRYLVVDHHLLRAKGWDQWMAPVFSGSQSNANEVLTMAELAGRPVNALEAKRAQLYRNAPPSPDFQHWASASDYFKVNNPPPLER